MSTSGRTAAAFGERVDTDGAFRRAPSQYRNLVTADGSSGFAVAPSRYHLYISRACPWAHRTLIGRRLMGLEDAIGISYVDPIRDERGWEFSGDGYDDPINGFQFLREAYVATDPSYAGRISVPVLWDRETGTVVNNESPDILRMLSTVFAPLAAHPVTLCPERLLPEIDELNEHIYTTVNDAVYKAGFATNQDVYEREVASIFATFDELDARLADRRFLFGDEPLETDWRLFPTLVRFDAVYHIHFKCSLRKLVEYEHLWPYTRDLYQWPLVAETVDFDEIRRHYYGTHRRINPTGRIAVMPAASFNEPPGRG